MGFSLENKSFKFSFRKGQAFSLSKSIYSVLYMNPSVMKILKYNKGSLVLVQTEEGQLLFRCWPCLSLESSSIMLESEKCFQNYIKGFAYCYPYDLLIECSDMVILNGDNLKHFMKSKSFRKILKKQLDSLYIREGLQLNICYMGDTYNFTIKKIYCRARDKINHQESLHDICKNMSSLDITGDNSVLEDSMSESSPLFFSTPVAKSSLSHLPRPEKKLLKQFYSLQSKTKIIIEKTEKVVSHSNHTFLHHLTGLVKQVSKIESLVQSLLNKDITQADNSYGILLVGASGTGKTAVVRAISNEYHLPVFNFDNSIFGSNDDYKSDLKKLYNEVIDNSPCILFLDNIDNLCSSRGNGYSYQESEIAALSTMIHDLLDSRHKVLTIGAARNISAVDASLRKPGTLEKEIYFEIPSPGDRTKILNKILEQKFHNLTTAQIAEISEMCHGFTGGDLKHLCSKANNLSSEAFITFEGLQKTLKTVKPSSVVEFAFEIPKVKWCDIGGMHAVKTAITEMVDWPLKHSEQFKKFGITPSRGILLYGPPGCSKTMIAKALAFESHLNFISIKGPQLFNKYVGESEKAVSDLFRKARSAAPCVLFFDEIDSLTSTRGSTSGNSNVSERILTQLLVEIDGVDVLQGVSIIAATNRPDIIDPSFLRPGRFDQMIYVPLPDLLSRKEIFEAKLRNIPHASDVDVTYLADATEGYSGAEIAEVCQEAAMLAVEDYLSSSSSVVTMIHFLAALKSVVPRTSKEMLKFYEEYNKRKVS